MNKVFEQIIEKLEEIRVKKTCNKEKCDTKELCRICVVDDAIEIVKQESEQYNNAIIDGKYCFQSCSCTEQCDKCSRLCNGDIDWYENIDNWTEQYNNGWIPVSEKLPEDFETYLVTNVDSFGQRHTYKGWYGVEHKIWHMEGNSDRKMNVVAWQPLPQPYTKGE